MYAYVFFFGPKKKNLNLKKNQNASGRLRYGHSQQIESHLGQKKLPLKIPVKFLFDRIHFNVSEEALFHCGRLIIRSERCVVQNQGINASDFGPKYPSLDPCDSKSLGLPERLGVLIFPLVDRWIFAVFNSCKPQPDYLHIRLYNLHCRTNTFFSCFFV